MPLDALAPGASGFVFVGLGGLGQTEGQLLASCHQSTEQTRQTETNPLLSLKESY